MKKAFKVLFLYPNGTLMNPPPISIGIFTAVLKREGFELALFDTTLYPEQGQASDEAKQQNRSRLLITAAGVLRSGRPPWPMI